jgi:hypothetical protein
VDFDPFVLGSLVECLFRFEKGPQGQEERSPNLLLYVFVFLYAVRLEGVLNEGPKIASSSFVDVVLWERDQLHVAVYSFHDIRGACLHLDLHLSLVDNTFRVAGLDCRAVQGDLFI